MSDFEEWISGTFFNECFQGTDRLNLEVTFNAGKRLAKERAAERIKELDKKLNQAIDYLTIEQRADLLAKWCKECEAE